MFDSYTLEIHPEENYVVVDFGDSPEQISVFTIEEWNEIENIFKEFHHSYQGYKRMSDTDLLRYSLE
jgi:hypothetical protein